MASLTSRMIRAAKLDSSVYEEVEQDRDATGQAMAVVVLTSLAAGLGALRGGGVAALVFVTLAALLGWVVWAFLTYFIGTRLLPEPQTKADLGELLRTTGFSRSPGMINLLGVVPGIGFLVLSVASIWMLITMVIAVRQALDYRSTVRAVGVCLIGWLIQIALLWLAGPSSLCNPRSSSIPPQ